MTEFLLIGQVEPCCRCGADYPAADLHLHGEVFCPACRGLERNGM